MGLVIHPHFIHSRFYCYSYVFGQLLVLALYRMYKDQGKSFVPKYIALLEAGGSDTPMSCSNRSAWTFTMLSFGRKGLKRFAL
jgi:oligoendopeptidase F